MLLDVADGVFLVAEAVLTVAVFLTDAVLAFVAAVTLIIGEAIMLAAFGEALVVQSHTPLNSAHAWLSLALA